MVQDLSHLQDENAALREALAQLQRLDWLQENVRLQTTNLLCILSSRMLLSSINSLNCRCAAARMLVAACLDLNHA